MIKLKSIVLCLLLVLYSGCITEYHPTGIDEISGMLVIEGIIEEGETIVKIRRSVGLTEDLGGNNVMDARVFVESNKGFVSAPALYDWLDGNYTINGITFEEGAEYRLNIIIGPDEYVSEFLAPLYTPEITGITALKRGVGEAVQICVNTEDVQDNSRYYLWSYEENWEYHARLYAQLGEALDGSGTIVDYSLSTANNIYNCWGDDYVTSFILDSAEKYSSNKIVNKVLTTLSPGSEKLSVLYHIKVKQRQLRKAAYDFFYNLQKNVDSGGSIFGSMPMEVKGNIMNVNNPDEVVIGYVEVSSRSEREQYFSKEEGLYEQPAKSCLDVTVEREGYIPYYREPDFTTHYAPIECLDCRTGYRASKRKPDFWPTSSL